MLKPEIGSLWTLEMYGYSYTGLISGYDDYGNVRVLVVASDRAGACGDTFTTHPMGFSKEKKEDRDVWLPLV